MILGFCFQKNIKRFFPQMTTAIRMKELVLSNQQRKIYGKNGYRGEKQTR